MWAVVLISLISSAGFGVSSAEACDTIKLYNAGGGVRFRAASF